jgi:hypothetical protein
MYTYTNGLFKGVSDTEFGPDSPMTRAMAVTALYRSHSSPDISGYINPFIDVSDSAYYYAPVVWAASKKIVLGIDAQTFNPDEFITRQQLAAILCRYSAFCGIPMESAGSVGGNLFETLNTKFVDANDMFEYAWAPILALSEKGIMNGGLGNRFNPNDFGTRAEMAAVIHRYIKQRAPSFVASYKMSDCG